MNRPPSLPLRRALALTLLFVGVTAVYLPSLQSGFVYDDHEVIEVQPRPRSVGDLARVFTEPHFRGLPYYRPVTRASLLAQKAIHGDDPGAFRAVNAALMGLAAVLAFALLRTPAFAIRPTLAWLAAAIFALHPAASSCVYPIASGRETLLPAVWILMAVLAWVRGRLGWAWFALGLALFSKEQAVIVPLVFLLADLCRVSVDGPSTSQPSPGVWLRRYGPVLGVVVAYAIARGLVLGGGDLRLAIDDDPLRPLLSYAYALQTGVAPFLGLVYEPDLTTWFSGARLAVAIAAMAGLAFVGTRVGAPPGRTVVFWVGWFIVVQLPTANLLVQEAHFAERYAFLALLALPALAAGVTSPLANAPSPHRAIVATGILLCVVVGSVSLGRAAFFRDDRAFARQWLEVQPHSADAHHLMGLIQLVDGEPAAAIEHLRIAKAGANEPADIQVNLGIALARVGRRHEAVEEFLAALAFQPDHPEAHGNLAVLRARDGRLGDSIAHYRASLESDPNRAGMHVGLAEVLVRNGQTAEAERHYRAALRLAPDDRRARQGLEALGRPASP